MLISEITTCLNKQRNDPNFPRDSAIFWLYYQQGWTAKDISELPYIDLQVKGVESALLRLTRIVRACLGGSRGTASGC
jgi:RNA polymerase sigma-70 factor (ECF subfamily)